MGIGHVAIGLALKRGDQKINVGWLVFAALLPDFLLGWFVLAGLESYTAPPDYASVHYLLFTFPWSHGLVANMVWAALASLTAFVLSRRRQASVITGIAVLSHFLLDGIVHVKGLPLFLSDGAVFGLGLWRFLPAELTIEMVMATLGLWIYSIAMKPERRSLGMMIYIALLSVFLVAGQAGARELPAQGGLIAGWLIGPPLMSAIAFWLDRKER
jgi:hypothetical protein